MALDSTAGGSSADSYVTLVEFKAYADKVAFAYGSDDAALEVALRKGAQYLDRTYQDRWIGYRTTKAQSLAWPRSSTSGLGSGSIGYVGVIDSDGFEIADDEVPQRIKDAQCEAAILSFGGTDLLPVLARGGAIASESVKAGPVTTATVYLAGAPREDQRLSIEGLLRGLIASGPGGGANGMLVRG